jgi:biopolymer transport protein ExbB
MTNLFIRKVASLGIAMIFALSLSPGGAISQEKTPLTASAATPPALTSNVANVSQISPATSAKISAAESIDNPYGIAALWKTSDAVAKFVLLILAIMSMGSWYILVVKILEQRKVASFAREAADKFWSAGSVEHGTAALNKDSPYQFIANSGLEATKKHSGLMGHIPLADWISASIQRAVDRVNRELQGGLAFLATVGSISPFVGLFGTVWGIYHALTAIGISGQASIDKVAGPVGESLIMTAIGLAVAVPAVLAYNWLISQNKGVMDDIRSFGSDLHSVLLGSSAKS